MHSKQPSSKMFKVCSGWSRSWKKIKMKLETMAQPVVTLQELNGINGAWNSQVRNGSVLNQVVNQFSTNYLQDCVCSGQFLQVKLDIRISISGEIRVPNASESEKEEKRTMRNEAYGILNWTWTTRILKMSKDLVKNPERKLAWWNLVRVFVKGCACVSSKSEVQNDSCTAIITNPITTLNSNLSSICGRSGKPIVTQSLVVSEVKPLSNRGCIRGTSSKDVLAIATSTKRCNSLSLYSSLRLCCYAVPCHAFIQKSWSWPIDRPCKKQIQLRERGNCACYLSNRYSRVAFLDNVASPAVIHWLLTIRLHRA